MTIIDCHAVFYNNNRVLVLNKFTPPEKAERLERYGSLDGLRAYAAIGIVIMHVLANISVKPSENYFTVTLIPWFTDFTLLFMVVSGFSLCCGYYERIKAGLITPNSFYKKRYIRILPFFASLCVLDVIISPSMYSLYEMFADMTLCFGLLPDVNISVIGVGWFLGVVFVFYMLFPFFVFLMDNRRRGWIVLVATLLLVWMATRYSFNGESPEPVIGRGNIVYCMPLFMAGGLVFLYRNPLSLFVNRHNRMACCIMLAGILTFFVLSLWEYSSFVLLLSELVLFTIVLIYAIGSDNILFNNRVVKYVSGLSMEIYLCHMVMFRVVERLHLENFISDTDCLYIVVSVSVMTGTIVFSHVMKHYLLKGIIAKFG